MEDNNYNDFKEESEQESEEYIENNAGTIHKEENKSLEVEKSTERIEEIPTNEIIEEEIVIDKEGTSTEELTTNSEELPLESKTIENLPVEIDLKDFHRNLIEAALYAAGSPLTIEELSTKLEFPKKEVEELLNELAFDYLERTTALIIAQIGERYQMQIRPEYTEEVSKFAKGGAIAEKYLRTLTIIALKQPILKSMVVKLRGTGAYEHVKYLIDNGFINAVKKGRSHELTTTDKYADMFGLPKDIRLLKQAMITQLGLEDGALREPKVESIPSEVESSIDENQNIDDNILLDEAEEIASREPMHESLPSDEEAPIDKNQNMDDNLPLDETEEDEE